MRPEILQTDEYLESMEASLDHANHDFDRKGDCEAQFKAVLDASIELYAGVARTFDQRH